MRLSWAIKKWKLQQCFVRNSKGTLSPRNVLWLTGYVRQSFIVALAGWWAFKPGEVIIGSLVLMNNAGILCVLEDLTHLLKDI